MSKRSVEELLSTIQSQLGVVNHRVAALDDIGHRVTLLDGMNFRFGEMEGRLAAAATDSETMAQLVVNLTDTLVALTQRLEQIETRLAAIEAPPPS